MIKNLSLFFDRVERIYTRILKQIKLQGIFGGISWLLRALIFRIYKFVMIVLSFPVAIGILFFQPILPIRIIRLRPHVIGHFALDTELLLSYKDRQLPDKFKNIYYYDPYGNIANTQLDVMWKRVIPIIPCGVLMHQIDRILIKISSRYRKTDLKLKSEIGGIQHCHVGLFAKTVPHLFFINHEILMANVIMGRLGLVPNTRFVCLLVRDSSYLTYWYSKPESDHYSHRNSDISNYKKAALYLAEKGYFVLRMGKIVAEPFDLHHPRIIDYANHELRSDFMDIYLAAHCHFFITSGTGLDAVANIFRRPILLTNFGQLYCYYDLSFFRMILPKNFVYSQTAQTVPLKQLLMLLMNSLQDSVLSKSPLVDNLRQFSVECIENTEDQILIAVEEMLESLNGTLSLSAEMTSLQAKFWRLYSEIMPIYGKLPIEVSSIISPSFLLQNQTMLSSIEEAQPTT